MKTKGAVSCIALFTCAANAGTLQTTVDELSIGKASFNTQYIIDSSRGSDKFANPTSKLDYRVTAPILSYNRTILSNNGSYQTRGIRLSLSQDTGYMYDHDWYQDGYVTTQGLAQNHQLTRSEVGDFSHFMIFEASGGPATIPLLDVPGIKTTKTSFAYTDYSAYGVEWLEHYSGTPELITPISHTIHALDYTTYELQRATGYEYRAGAGKWGIKVGASLGPALFLGLDNHPLRNDLKHNPSVINIGGGIATQANASFEFQAGNRLSLFTSVQGQYSYMMGATAFRFDDGDIGYSRLVGGVSSAGAVHIGLKYTL